MPPLPKGDAMGRAPLAQPHPAVAMPPLTPELLTLADDSNDAGYYLRIVDDLNRQAACYGVTTTLRMAHFLAQVGHECGFRASEENGSHAPQRMRELFGCKGGPANYDAVRDDCASGAARIRPKLWTAPATYAANARNLLSYVHAQRFGNGDEVSGDGYRYRGRGLLQVSGKAGYRAFTDCHNNNHPDDRQDFVACPDLLLARLDYAVETAFFVWDEGDINTPADQDDLVEVTRRVHGALDGLADRAARLGRLKLALGLATDGGTAT
jgi:predicted chitinase